MNTRETSKKPRICIVRHREYGVDPRLNVQAQALLEAGYDVDVLGMRLPGEPYSSLEGNAQVYRIPSLPRKRGNKVRYFAEYVSFLIFAFIYLAWLQIRRNYSLIHVCNLPDFLVFAALVPKVLGVKVILDFRECTPEQYHTKYGVDMDSVLMKALIAIEQNSIKFSSVALTCTEPMRQAFIQRGTNPDKVFVMLNSANPDHFKDPVLPDPDGEPKDTFQIVTHGTIIKRYGHDILIKAMPHVLKQVPAARLEIMGSGEWQPELEELVTSLRLDEVVTFSGYLPLAEMIKRIRAADCGAVPLPLNIETDLIHTNKMQEYMALGIPVVISRTRAVESYFSGSAVCFFEPDNEKDLAQALVKLHHNPQLRYNLAKNALAAYEEYSAPKQQKHYVNLVQSLLVRPVSGEQSQLWQSDNQPSR